MEISNYTIEVLKNYADIQKNMWFKKGNQQASVSSGEDLFSQISFEETFPQDFGIYDLPQFLACLSFIDSPRLHFSDSYVTITDSAGLEKIDFRFSPPDHLTFPPGTLERPEPVVTFTLTSQILNKIWKSSSILGFTECAFKKEGDNFTVSVVDTEDETSNIWVKQLDCEVYSEQNFNFVFDISTFKMIDGDYEVTCNKPMTHFKNLNHNLEYWVAMQNTSSYGE